MTAALITIGDEILSGTTVDTNSNFIASQLKQIGIAVAQILTVGDEVQLIKAALTYSFEKADLVITTGGLGPTKDDRTKKAFAEFFDDSLILHEATLRHLEELFRRRNREHLLDLNKPQAEIPSKAEVFQNFHGTAPSFLMRKGPKMALCLPGVPYEVKPLIKDQIIPYLAEQYRHQHIVSRIISVVNIPESLLAKQIEDWELALPKEFTLSYLPIANRIKLKLTAVGNTENELHQILDQETAKLRMLIGDQIISENGDRIEEILKDILTRKNLTISTAESCTGGELSKLITSVPGISANFLGGVVCYETKKKSEILGVAAETIRTKTAVSAEVAQEMSQGCQKLFKTDISISTTGIAGPSSDEHGNEVGMVFYSIRVADFEKTVQLSLPHLERKDFMTYVAMKAIQDLIQILVENPMLARGSASS